MGQTFRFIVFNFTFQKSLKPWQLYFDILYEFFDIFLLLLFLKWKNFC